MTEQQLMRFAEEDEVAAMAYADFLEEEGRLEEAGMIRELTGSPATASEGWSDYNWLFYDFAGDDQGDGCGTGDYCLVVDGGDGIGESYIAGSGENYGCQPGNPHGGNGSGAGDFGNGMIPPYLDLRKLHPPVYYSNPW